MGRGQFHNAGQPAQLVVKQAETSGLVAVCTSCCMCASGGGHLHSNTLRKRLNVPVVISGERRGMCIYLVFHLLRNF